MPPIERTIAVAPNNTVSVRIARKSPDYQSGVDAFFRSAVASYATPAGVPTGAAAGRVIVAPTFMMGRGYENQQEAKGNTEDKRKYHALASLAQNAGLSSEVFGRLQVARGTPNEFRTFTQAAISAQPGDMVLTNSAAGWQPLDVRKIMHGNATGFDCAGYVQQAYLSATGRTRDQLGWKGLSVEGLFNLPGHGFRKFQKVGDLRPGDIIVFKSSDPKDRIEHRAIVFDQRVANDDDARVIAGATGMFGA
ncbi:MAG: hypothetical protein ACRELB_12895, partial [Polyangiaceae bacterium]